MKIKIPVDHIALLCCVCRVENGLFKCSFTIVDYPYYKKLTLKRYLKLTIK